MRILLDSNIVLRSVEPLHAQHELSVDAIDTLRQRGHDLIIVPQVLYEFWSVATRPIEQNALGMSPAEAHTELITIRRLFRLLLDERAVYSIWEQLVTTLNVKGKRAHDARLASAMQRHAVSHILTFNAVDFSRFDFVTVLTPVEVLGRMSNP
jgi:predicted nucleic acid-binding protein